MSFFDRKNSIDPKRATVSENAYTVIIVLIVVFCIVMLLIHPLVTLTGKSVSALDVTANIGWKYEDGSSADLENIKFVNGRGVITRDITSVFTSGHELCFETSNLFFKVYLNNELIYQFEPKMPNYYGFYYGDYTHIINIPYFTRTGQLKIEYEALTQNRWTNFRNARMTSGTTYLRDGIGAGIFSFALCFSTIIVGLIMILMGLAFHLTRNGIIESISLGTLALLVASYLMSGTNIWQLLFLDSAMPRLMEYLDLALFPIPIATFAAAYTDTLNKKLPRVICATSFTLLAMIGVLLITHWFDFSVLLYAIHTNIMLGVVCMIYLFISMIRVKSEKSPLRHISLIVAFIILMVTAMIDITLYYVSNSTKNVHVVNYGLAIFIIILAVYEINNILDINRKNTEASATAKLARLDVLTGLANRLAFDEAEKKLASDSGSSATLTLFDVNFLKKVNDEYGHAEGDRHIKAAAAAINASFGQYGTCFRTGGDEFFSIITGESHAELAREAADKLALEIERYNSEVQPPIKLEVAHGSSEYEYGVNTIEEAEKQSDSKMYENKKIMKENR